MKSYYYKLGWAIFPFALLAASCQNDDFMKTDQQTSAGMITLRATMGNYNDTQSRAQVVLGTEDETREIFQWNEGDSFILYDFENPSGTSGTFTISGYTEDEAGADATFVGKGDFAKGTGVTAIYPAQEGNSLIDNTLTLTIPGAAMTDGSAEDWKNYMRQCMYMSASATMDGNNTELAFRHLCAMIRVSYTNATTADQAISKITLTGNGDFFGLEAVFSFADNTATATTSSSTCEFDFSSLTVASGRTADFYFLFFPGKDASSGTLTININGDKEISMTLSDMEAFAGFKAGQRYWLNTIETPEGFAWKKDVPEMLITNLPLIQLAEKQNNVTFEKDENGYVNVLLNQEQISRVLSISPDSSIEIDNLDGLEYFTNLEYLRVDEMNLTALDVSKLANLTELDCTGNPNLGTLDVSANTKLQRLYCENIGLTALDVSKNTELIILDCACNDIAELDLKQNIKLESLIISTNDAISSDLLSLHSGLKELIIAQCPQITELDVSGLTNLEMLSCGETGISSLDVSNNKELIDLNCCYTSISILDVSNNTRLERLWCGNTNLSELNLENNLLLEELEIQGIPSFDDITLSKNTALKNLYLGGSGFTTLDISNQPMLTRLSCVSTNIGTLDISKNPELESLDCSYCSLQQLDITQNPKLEYLSCGNQRYVPIITLRLTTEQEQNLWIGNMEWESGNGNVTLEVIDEASD